jgi:hypothetical protein
VLVRGDWPGVPLGNWIAVRFSSFFSFGFHAFWEVYLQRSRLADDISPRSPRLSDQRILAGSHATTYKFPLRLPLPQLGWPLAERVDNTLPDSA